jgi:hypothetical protein
MDFSKYNDSDKENMEGTKVHLSSRPIVAPEVREGPSDRRDIAVAIYTILTICRMNLSHEKQGLERFH